MADGDIDTNAAMDSLLAKIKDDPHRFLTVPDDYLPVARSWSRAVGYKDGRPTRSTCWYTAPVWELSVWFLTSMALVAAGNMVLRGDVTERGAFAAETALKPLLFFAECARLVRDSVPEGKLINESVEYLDAAEPLMAASI